MNGGDTLGDCCNYKKLWGYSILLKHKKNVNPLKHPFNSFRSLVVALVSNLGRMLKLELLGGRSAFLYPFYLASSYINNSFLY